MSHAEHGATRAVPAGDRHTGERPKRVVELGGSICEGLRVDEAIRLRRQGSSAQLPAGVSLRPLQTESDGQRVGGNVRVVEEGGTNAQSVGESSDRQRLPARAVWPQQSDPYQDLELVLHPRAQPVK